MTQVYADPPKAAQVLEGDFVGGVIADETAEPQDRLQRLRVPGDRRPGLVVGGGDVMVMFKDNPAARALIEYLATPEAAEIWAAKGGFSSPNKNVDAEVYPDELTKQTATELANAEVFRFDMSDLMPRLRQRFALHAAAGLREEPGRRGRDRDQARGGGGVRVHGGGTARSRA